MYVLFLYIPDIYTSYIYMTYKQYIYIYIYVYHFLINIITIFRQKKCSTFSWLAALRLRSVRPPSDDPEAPFPRSSTVEGPRER
jgi:hypothetical protein